MPVDLGRPAAAAGPGLALTIRLTPLLRSAVGSALALAELGVRLPSSPVIVPIVAILPLTEFRSFRESPTVVLAMVKAARVTQHLVLRLRLGIGRSIFRGGGHTRGGPTGDGTDLHEWFLRTCHRLGLRAEIGSEPVRTQ